MNKKQIAITLGVMCFLLTIAICVQLRTMSSASSTVSQTLSDNGLRHEVALKIKAAREFGDLSENAEYDEAKQEQGFIEGEIREIEYKLKHALIFDDETKTKDVVSLGSRMAFRMR